MTTNAFSIKIGGGAGQGIKSTGLLLAKCAVRAGLNVYDYIEYPSLIRGGHNVMQINVSAQEVTGPFLKCDFLIALNQDTLDKHCQELTADAGILYDGDKNFDLTKLNQQINRYPIPLASLAAQVGGKELASNTVALGASVALLGGNIQCLLTLIEEEYKNKDPEICKINILAAQKGYDFGIKEFSNQLRNNLKSPDTTDSAIPRIVINGNDAAALGAIASGLEFAAIYPMSPISGILATLASLQETYGFIYKQPEDEISAINMAIGASFGGARSMTATSGGGFCLMTEGLGLAGMTETPLVVIEGMRGGPATGLPTWSGQGDLRMVLHAHQGEFPRIILAPGDAKETFELTLQAFNLADKYQTPVVILIDKDICDNDQSFLPFNTNGYKINRGKLAGKVSPDYCRYKLEEDGISPRAFAGSGNFFITNSDEHNEQGFSSEDIAIRNLQMTKRMQKLLTCAKEEMQGPQLFGPKEADLTIVSWGSNKGPILQALKEFPNVNFLHLTWLNPFPAEMLKKALKNAKRLLAVECNFSGQLSGLIKEQTGVHVVDKLLKYDGRPFFVEELTNHIKLSLKGASK